jgi:pentapeptide MXKDX repeat protein
MGEAPKVTRLLLNLWLRYGKAASEKYINIAVRKAFLPRSCGEQQEKTDGLTRAGRQAVLRRVAHSSSSLTTHSFRKGTIMNKLFVSLMTVCMCAVAGQAIATDDMMKKDGMSKDSMSKDAMSKDSMSKDTMKKDGMKKETHAPAMKKDSMGKSAMSKDSMSKDSMKKDSISK